MVAVQRDKYNKEIYPITRNKSYCLKENSDSNSKYTEENIIKMLESSWQHAGMVF